MVSPKQRDNSTTNAIVGTVGNQCLCVCYRMC